MTRIRTIRRAAGAAAVTMIAAGCAPDAQAERTLTESRGALATAAPEGARATDARAALHLVVGQGKNEARYRVRERLMGRDLDNDAVGVTSEVTGGIALDSAGAIIPSLSRFVVQTANFASDAARRDGYVRGRLLEATQHPTVTFVPTAVRGLPAAAATSRAATLYTFQLVGDLTVKGVTRPATWSVTARRAGTGVTGSAATAFTFGDFGLTQPRVPVVLSVADTIRLEYDFTLAPAPTTSSR